MIFLSQREKLMTKIDNIPLYGVSEFNNRIKDVLNQEFGYIKIKGEISSINQGRIGQLFITFKDEDSILNGVIWKNKKNNISFNLEEGLEVIALGKITTYSKSISTYQIDIDDIEISGEGALLKIIEERKKRLSKEGLFDDKFKKKLPFLPQKIGIITSPTGAVIHDILNRLNDRFPILVDLWPTSVQGREAPRMIIEAIDGFNSKIYIDKPDVIIIARGGGNVEDLMAFNDEKLIRKVFDSKIPVVSAIGHETDYTILDLVCDLRAPTPTAAAEMIVPVRDILIDNLNSIYEKLNQTIKNKYDLVSENYSYFNRLLRNPKNKIENYSEKFFSIKKNFKKSINFLIENKSNTLKHTYSLLKEPSEILKLKKNQYKNLTKNVTSEINQKIKENKYSLDSLKRLLVSNSIDNNLKKGYAIVKKRNLIVKRAKFLQRNDNIEIKFYDKKITTKVK
mgnify:FL=1